MKTKNIVAALTAFTSAFSMAENNIEVITIVNQQSKTATQGQITEGKVDTPDAAEWLEAIPGAGVNRNGGVTGIAQYRGLYGDRVAMTLSGHHIIGSGPNAMDAPMSYIPVNMVDSMTAYRGITPVYAGIDTLGGAIEVNLKKAQLSNSNFLSLDGQIDVGYQQQGDAKFLAPNVNISNNQHAVLVYITEHTADESEDAEGRILPSSQYDKLQYGLDYRTKLTNGSIGFGVHITDTQNSGTAALPMDILFIEGQRVDLSGQHELNNWSLDWQLGHLISDHEMDNHSLRHNMMSDMYRLNTAAAATTDFKVTASTNTALGHLTLGSDGYFAIHDSTITSATNMMFSIKNFNNVADNRVGLFAHLDSQLNQSNLSLGIRVKQSSADADEVSHHMAMMNANIKTLQDNFNNANRSQNEVNLDVAANWTMSINNHSQILVGAGFKQRAPSYQERYLWVPMQATGGLADGHTYIGNIELDSESATQFNLGYSYKEGNFSISPNIFFQQIDDYIQAAPSTNMAANMVGNMMMGAVPLQFSNVDAEIYGADLTARYKFSETIVSSAIASYVRGKRTDISDNLYRISAPNIKVSTTYYAKNWQLITDVHMFAEQDKVSEINSEQSSSGYALVNLAATYYWQDVNLELSIKNLLDKHYSNHLAGVNRTMMTDIPTGDKLPAQGRNIGLSVNWAF